VLSLRQSSFRLVGAFAPSGLGPAWESRPCRPHHERGARATLRSLAGRFSLFAFRPALVVAALLGVASVAQAHDPFSSSATAQVTPENLVLTVAMAQSAARDLLEKPANAADEGITDENFDRYRERFAKRALTLYSITAGGVTLRPIEAKTSLSGENDVEFEVRYPRPTAGPLRFRALYLNQMSDGHVATLYVENAARDDLGWGYLEAAAPILEVALPTSALALAPAPGGSATAPAGERPKPTAPSFGAFLKLGIEHILTGYDHLLFLAGLLIACRRFSTMAGIITCFTLAHSITLALAALNVVSIPSRVVEPLIAASIVYVGIENLLRRGTEPKGRWALTFGFGLVHGFGFASALKEIGLGAGGSSLLAPLFSFNLGVEVGQITVAALFLPILFRLRRSPDFVRYGLPAASSLVVLLGGYWLLQRTVFS
jgi:hydrogenase/urease accessory protein HupE